MGLFGCLSRPLHGVFISLHPPGARPGLVHERGAHKTRARSGSTPDFYAFFLFNRLSPSLEQNKEILNPFPFLVSLEFPSTPVPSLSAHAASLAAPACPAVPSLLRFTVSLASARHVYAPSVRSSFHGPDVTVGRLLPSVPILPAP